MTQSSDILIIGGGPAVGTAALYAARIGRPVTVLAGALHESLLAATDSVDNLPGLPQISGTEFLTTLRRQCQDAGVVWIEEHARSLRLENRRKFALTESGIEYDAPALIIATGGRAVRPEIPGFDRFWGKGVSVCAWCDGAHFRGRAVAVYGGGNTAFSFADLLRRTSERVYLLLPPGGGSAFSSLRASVTADPRVEVIENVRLTGLTGGSSLEEMILDIQGTVRTVPVPGLFLALGQRPNAEIVCDLLDLGTGGFIRADAQGRTNVPGIFAAGDVVEHRFRQVTVACGPGAAACLAAEKYLNAQWG